MNTDELEFNLFFDLARAYLVLSMAKDKRFKKHMRWYYTGYLSEILTNIELHVNRINELRNHEK